uniref:Uncharacterized protein n=1 Tax=Cacopsylla melanoneura TaxID=428564 RepID=A0A8D8Q9D3_9HEMI
MVPSIACLIFSSDLLISSRKAFTLGAAHFFSLRKSSRYTFRLKLAMISSIAAFSCFTTSTILFSHSAFSELSISIILALNCMLFTSDSCMSNTIGINGKQSFFCTINSS